MKSVLNRWIHIGLIVIMIAVSAAGSGWATEETGDGSAAVPGTPAGGQGSVFSGELVPTGYSADRTSISKGSTVKITVQLKYADQSAGEGITVDATRLVDSFSGGIIDSSAITVTPAGQSFLIDIPVSGLVYGGTGNSLKLMVSIGGKYEQIEIPIKECKEYEEPVYEPSIPETPDPIPAPMALMSRSEMETPMRAGETRTITIYVKNIGTSVMKSPLISFTASDSLFLPGTSSTLQMKDIYGGKTESVDIKVQALDDISSVSQYLDMELKFRYYNMVNMADGSSSGRVTIPAEVKKKAEEKPEEPEVVIDSPVPNLIISGFHYGGSSVAAGSEFGLSFQFVNTSSKLPVENVVVTLEGGEGFTINGGTNTFYFEKIKEGGSKSVSVPMKVQADVKNGAKPVNISFKYEYVDHNKRMPVNSQMQITVPVYQPDRFEITHPSVPVMVYTGEETSITMNYVNKSKSDILNVEAVLEGNVETYTPVQNLGNMEPGKSGTVAFAVTAWEAGTAEFTIKFTYEDGNGTVKTREFPVTMTVEEMMMDDPGMYEPMPEPEPEPQTNWKLIGAIAAAAVLILIVLIRKKKKSDAVKKDEALWSSWDEITEPEKEEAAK